MGFTSRQGRRIAVAYAAVAGNRQAIGSRKNAAMHKKCLRVARVVPIFVDMSTSTHAPRTTNATIIEAIVRLRCVAATYNRAPVVLAPHVLYTRNDALYVDAITVTRDGLPPREPKMGTFKLDGLGAVELIEEGFSVSTIYDPAEPRYGSSQRFEVQSAEQRAAA